MEVLEESPVPSPVRESSPEPESPSPKKTSKPHSDDEPVIVSQTNGGEKRRKRTRKLVPKTSMDADGFMGKYVEPFGGCIVLDHSRKFYFMYMCQAGILPKCFSGQLSK